MLSKLEEDGLVSHEVVEQELLPDRKVYSLTELGQKELDRWLTEPTPGPVRVRDELLLNVVMHFVLGRADRLERIWEHRETYMRALAEIARMRTDPGLPSATALLLDALALRMEADLKWLELCEDAARSDRGGQP